MLIRGEKRVEFDGEEKNHFVALVYDSALVSLQKTWTWTWTGMKHSGAYSVIASETQPIITNSKTCPDSNLITFSGRKWKRSSTRPPLP